MSIYLSVDGGGSKLTAILFNDHFEFIGRGDGSSVNHYLAQTEFIEETMQRCIDGFLPYLQGKAIEKVYISMAGPVDLFVGLLRRFVPVEEIVLLDEGLMSLLAGLQRKQGIVALAGTGSGVFWVNQEQPDHIGGWGSVLGDEGSGFFIGRKGIMAAIRSEEGRGPQTRILDLLREEWKVAYLREAMSDIYGRDFPRTAIASVAKLVSKAAEMGDEEAVRIVVRAGEEMALQVNAMLNRKSVSRPVEVMVAGGAWKGSKSMVDAFSTLVCTNHPNARIRLPLFDPVMGGVILHCLETRLNLKNGDLQNLRKNFAQFLYQTE